MRTTTHSLTHIESNATKLLPFLHVEIYLFIGKPQLVANTNVYLAFWLQNVFRQLKKFVIHLQMRSHSFNISSEAARLLELRNSIRLGLVFHYDDSKTHCHACET